MSFVNLHVHSAQGSLLDSILTVKDIAKYAKENGQPAIALSLHLKRLKCGLITIRAIYL